MIVVVLLLSVVRGKASARPRIQVDTITLAMLGIPLQQVCMRVGPNPAGPNAAGPHLRGAGPCGRFGVVVAG